MTCEARNDDNRGGLRCTLDAEHAHGHVFVASGAPDAHDRTEAEAEANR